MEPSSGRTIGAALLATALALAGCGSEPESGASPSASAPPVASPTATTTAQQSASPSPTAAVTSSPTAAVTPSPTPPPSPSPTAERTPELPAFPALDPSVPVQGGDAVVVILAATTVGDETDTRAIGDALGGFLADHGFPSWGAWGTVGCSDGAADLLADAGFEGEVDLVYTGYFASAQDAEAFRAAWDARHPEEPVLAVGPVTTYCLD